MFILLESFSQFGSSFKVYSARLPLAFFSFRTEKLSASRTLAPATINLTFRCKQISKISKNTNNALKIQFFFLFSHVRFKNSFSFFITDEIEKNSQKTVGGEPKIIIQKKIAEITFFLLATHGDHLLETKKYDSRNESQHVVSYVQRRTWSPYNYFYGSYCV